MAIKVVAQARFYVTIVVAALDTNNKFTTRSKDYELAATVTTHADAETAAQALMADLDAINEADIVGYTIRTVHGYDNTTPVAVVGNLWKEAVLSLVPAIAGDKITHTIYAPDDTLAPAGGGVNTSYANLLAYLDNFEQAGATFQLSDGEFIATDNQIASARIRRVGSKDT